MSSTFDGDVASDPTTFQAPTSEQASGVPLISLRDFQTPVPTTRLVETNLATTSTSDNEVAKVLVETEKGGTRNANEEDNDLIPSRPARLKSRQGRHGRGSKAWKPLDLTTISGIYSSV